MSLFLFLHLFLRWKEWTESKTWLKSLLNLKSSDDLRDMLIEFYKNLIMHKNETVIFTGLSHSLFHGLVFVFTVHATSRENAQRKHSSNLDWQQSATLHSEKVVYYSALIFDILKLFFHFIFVLKSYFSSKKTSHYFTALGKWKVWFCYFRLFLLSCNLILLLRLQQCQLRFCPSYFIYLFIFSYNWNSFLCNLFFYIDLSYLT